MCSLLRPTCCVGLQPQAEMCGAARADALAEAMAAARTGFADLDGVAATAGPSPNPTSPAEKACLRPRRSPMLP